eukprot:8705191-Pyramimonas_sp.AAC.2
MLQDGRAGDLLRLHIGAANAEAAVNSAPSRRKARTPRRRSTTASRQIERLRDGGREPHARR